MKLSARVPVTAGLMALTLLSATGCKTLRANDQINKGVADFKNAKYESATNHFQSAVNIDPENPNPKIYLATTYASQVVPDLNSPENMRLANLALKTFGEVLERNPNDVIALRQIASLDRSIGRMEQAKDYEKKVIQQDANDPEAYYTIGVVDWSQAYKNSVAALGKESLTDKSDGNLKLSKPGCAALVAQNTPLVNEGLQELQKAISINPTYEEAMTYMSLMERRKADLECGNVEAVKADLQAADDWAQKSMGARKVNEQRKEAKSHGVQM